MTDMDRAVTRRTVQPYRVTITGAYPDASGRKLVVQLTNNGHGDMIRIREAGRRNWIAWDVPELYRRGLIAQAQANAKRKKKGKAQ